MPEHTEDQQEMLHDLWKAMLKATLEILKGNPSEIKGSTLKEARQFLLDNGITIDTINPGGGRSPLQQQIAADAASIPSSEELDRMLAE